MLVDDVGVVSVADVTDVADVAEVDVSGGICGIAP